MSDYNMSLDQLNMDIMLAEAEWNAAKVELIQIQNKYGNHRAYDEMPDDLQAEPKLQRVKVTTPATGVALGSTSVPWIVRSNDI